MHLPDRVTQSILAPGGAKTGTQAVPHGQGWLQLWLQHFHHKTCWRLPSILIKGVQIKGRFCMFHRTLSRVVLGAGHSPSFWPPNLLGYSQRLWRH